MGRAVGIDLGTTYSAVAVIGEFGKPEILPNREGDRITPSVVMFSSDMTLVGSMAHRSAATAPDDVVQFVKRMMGDPAWRFITSAGERYGAEEVSAVILRRLKDDAEIALGEPVTDAVITVPAYFDDARRLATRDAGEIAGLNVLRVLNEPTAAALAFGLDSQAAGNVLVFDLGGGTFDVTIMRVGGDQFDVIATMGDRNLGGFDWDNELIRYVTEHLMRQTGVDVTGDDLKMAELREKAEMAKRSLTTMPEARILLSVAGKMMNIPVSRDLFAELTRGLLGRTLEIAEWALDDAGLTWAELDHVLLVGGSTRMPMVQEAVFRRSGRQPARGVNPDEVVALGAAIQCHLLVEQAGTTPGPTVGSPSQTVRISDVAAHGLGVVAVDRQTRTRQNVVLVGHNAKVPARGSDEFETSVDQQREIHIEITEGDDTDVDFVKIVGSSVFAMPPYPKGSPIRVEISLDHDAVIHAEVFDNATGAKLGDLEIERDANMSRSRVAEAGGYIQRLQVG